MKLNINAILSEIDRLHLKYQAGMMDARRMSHELDLLKTKLKAVELYDIERKLANLKTLMESR